MMKRTGEISKSTGFIMSITEERLKEIKDFKNTDFSDCPVLTEEQLAQFGPSRLRGIYKPIKKAVNIRLDADIIEWLKSGGEGYQARMNAILHREMLRTMAAVSEK
jgi:uncharacterized protein (DUF4415 family)